MLILAILLKRRSFTIKTNIKYELKRNIDNNKLNLKHEETAPIKICIYFVFKRRNIF